MDAPSHQPPPARERVLFPLWIKLGALFGGVYGLAVAGYGAWDWSVVVEEQARAQRAELEELASVVAAGIDGDAHASFTSESDRARPEFARAVQLLRLASERSELVYYASTCAPDAQGFWRYVVDGDREAPYPIGFPIFDGILEREEAYEGRLSFVPALRDDSGRWDTVLAPIRTPDGAVVGLVELIADADRSDLVLEGRFRRTAWQLAAGVTAALALAFVFGRLVSGNLLQLVVAAERVSRGKLDTRISVRSWDEIGLLADRFNRMVEGLQEREFIRETFGRFVNREVVAQILEDRSRLRLGGESRVVTVLMSDLRGFTALGEELGPERMVSLLNAYLARMTTVVESFDGNVAELLGDGLVVLFGAPVRHDDDARRAVACAVAMHRELIAFNEEQGRRLQMGIGVDTGAVIAGNIGDERHMKYGVVGAAINVAARLESFTLGNQVLVSEATRAAVGEGLAVDEALEFKVKGRRGTLRAWPVRGIGDLTMPDELEGVHVDGSWPAVASRLDGKRVDDASHPVTLIRLELDVWGFAGDLAVSDRDKLKIELTLDHLVLDEIYGTVESTRPGGFTLRVSSMPPEARTAVEHHLSEHVGDATGSRLGEPTGSRG
jgi:class 3 adenylate cyclase